MIIEGPILIGILLIVALALVALVVYIRLAVMKQPVSLSISGRAKNGSDEDSVEETEELSPEPSGKEVRVAAAARNPDDDLLELIAEQKMAASGNKPDKKDAGKAGEPKPSIPSRIMGILTGILSFRKNKKKLAEEVQAIDKEIDQVLQQSHEINAPSAGMPEIAMGTSVGTGFTSMDEISVQVGGKDLPDPMSTGDVQFGLLENNFGPDGNAGEIPAGQSAPQANNMPSAPARPAEAAPGPGTPKPPENMFEQKGGTDNLLDEIASETTMESSVDLSIMKEFKDMPITCEDLEGDLKGILDQITVTDGSSRKNKNSGA